MALRFKDYTFNSSGHRVENCSSRYSFLNDERDGAIFIFKDKEFHNTMPWEVNECLNSSILIGGGTKL